jgi:hypothetical protein
MADAVPNHAPDYGAVHELTAVVPMHAHSDRLRSASIEEYGNAYVIGGRAPSKT